MKPVAPLSNPSPPPSAPTPAPAPAPAPASVAARVAGLPHLSMRELWKLWDKHFDDRPAHHQRQWVESRLAYRIQELAFGGLKPSLRRKLEEIGETGLMPGQRSHRHGLLPGSVITRVYDDVEHHVSVHGDKSFEYQGQRFKSLSAIAAAITGSHWSGPLFFGLKPRHKGKEHA